MIKRERESKKPICYNWMWLLHHHLILKSVTERKKNTKVSPISRRNCISSIVDDAFYFFQILAIYSLKYILKKKRKKRSKTQFLQFAARRQVLKVRVGDWCKKLKKTQIEKIFYPNVSEELILLKCILLKVIYKSNMNPVKTPMAVFTEIEKKP